MDQLASADLSKLVATCVMHMICWVEAEAPYDMLLQVVYQVDLLKLLGCIGQAAPPPRFGSFFQHQHNN
jgi:hypothetical protein